ncbi:hypothetical protein CALVIDRAFT_596897 [Calocera viscosa TUFC12733]|uniref:NADH2 dehydrogenase n=1 Tax=Calocera viscosa (strain TUFC12733) TaxID=1330018 RepID=A0A167P337_CALVF|nr:hypothetical protein CALVIDRAFT_596897 [Calocera viscosa TUFC12733]
MFRISRPLLQAIRQTTNITGLRPHPDPVPALTTTYEKTLSMLQTIPSSSIYRQGTEALTQRKLDIVKAANGDAVKAEKELEEGLIEQAIQIAEDELSLVAKMIEWKAWEPLEEKAPPGQWQYFENNSMKEV